MKKVRIEILGLSPSQTQSGSFALVLGEVGGNRRLPIIIGMFEAQAIVIEIEKIVPNRPMTHDLFGFFSQAFRFTISEIRITELREGIFFAKIICTDGTTEHEIDARPSDAIAIALRFAAPVYTTEAILIEAGIVASEIDEQESEEQPAEKSLSFKETIKATALSELQKMLNDALEHEEYEKAAIIRDEIEHRN